MFHFESFFLLYQGSHIARFPGHYILQWKFHSSPTSSSTIPVVPDVLYQVTHTAKAKVIFYYEVLDSEDFRSVNFFEVWKYKYSEHCCSKTLRFLRRYPEKNLSVVIYTNYSCKVVWFPGNTVDQWFPTFF